MPRRRERSSSCSQASASATSTSCGTRCSRARSTDSPPWSRRAPWRSSSARTMWRASSRCGPSTRRHRRPRRWPEATSSRPAGAAPRSSCPASAGTGSRSRCSTAASTGAIRTCVARWSAGSTWSTGIRTSCPRRSRVSPVSSRRTGRAWQGSSSVTTGRQDCRVSRPTRVFCRSESWAGSRRRTVAGPCSAAATFCSPGSSAQSTPTPTATSRTPRRSLSSAASSPMRRSPRARRRAPRPARPPSGRSSSRRWGTTAGPGQDSGRWPRRRRRRKRSRSERSTRAARCSRPMPSFASTTTRSSTGPCASWAERR